MLNEEILRNDDSCENSIKELLRHFPMGYDGPWTLETQLGCVKLGLGRYLGTACHRGYFTAHSMAGQKFDGEDLTKVDLSYMNLQGASFKGCNLTYANFQGADLREVDFRDAVLYRTRLRDCNLQGAFLEMVDLTTADLVRAKL